MSGLMSVIPNIIYFYLSSNHITNFTYLHLVAASNFYIGHIGLMLGIWFMVMIFPPLYSSFIHFCNCNINDDIFIYR